MTNKGIFLGLAIVLALAISLTTVSAYNHATFRLSDSITFSEDIKGEDRGFSLRRSTDVPRLTTNGYYDWSYRPKVIYPDSGSYKISDRITLEAFKTFQQDSKDENKIRLERERNRYRYGYGYGGYSYGRYGGYYGGYGGYGGYGYYRLRF